MPESEFEVQDSVTAKGKGVGIVIAKEYRSGNQAPAYGVARVVGGMLPTWWYRVTGGGFNPVQWYSESTLDGAVL